MTPAETLPDHERPTSDSDDAPEEMRKDEGREVAAKRRAEESAGRKSIAAAAKEKRRLRSGKSVEGGDAPAVAQPSSTLQLEGGSLEGAHAERRGKRAGQEKSRMRKGVATVQEAGLPTALGGGADLLPDDVLRVISERERKRDEQTQLKAEDQAQKQHELESKAKRKRKSRPDSKRATRVKVVGLGSIGKDVPSLPPPSQAAMAFRQKHLYGDRVQRSHSMLSGQFAAPFVKT